MFVGVYGHKPTPFVCSPFGHNPQSDDPRWGTFFTTAPMTRYSEDLALLLDAVRDKNGPEVQLFKEVDVTKLNFYFMKSDRSGMTQPLSPCIKKSLLKISKHFNAQHADLPLMKWSLDISMCSMLQMPFDTIYSTTEEGQKQKSTGSEICKKFTGRSEAIMPSVMISTLQFAAKNIPVSRKRQLDKIKKQLKEDLLKLLGDNGVLLFPTFPSSANKHFEIYYRLLDPIYLMVFNTLGLPVTQVNTGFDKNSMPIGIQVVAAPGNDHLSIAVARDIESHFGGWTPLEKMNNETTRI